MSQVKQRKSSDKTGLRGKWEGEKGQEKTFNPYPFTFSPN
ncbi:hypothetical protein FDUTEX481_03180 [Tolypothrix sp. PCC 7601]|nr:hypothetical protein FDUTEX481_03180 [Tolypothrix sp. PCC 7601]